ncbi:pilus assembly protein PilA [Aliidiomarina taiwanensis]|uniref:Pilus assembly protein PilA n=1 Tax=Aliidiomarina taiwanensis TaxID=946228 RepID=A0A432X7U1_9GAMM|nr:prepilin-type N-terminal cleavage/methylation domain-containing protein [Aliidiomarina taiwanensis]RUO42902.1 pilus assembly protein PilA [Aliidiomarina taiwanensis]
MRYSVFLFRGFSLIELMIVVAILGILSTLAVPAFTDYTQRAQATTSYLALQPWQTAIALCWQEQGSLDPCNQLGSAGIPPEPNPYPQGVEKLTMGNVSGALRANLSARDSQGNLLTIEVQPVVQTTQLSWQLLCSDYALGSRLKHCAGPLPAST